MDDALAKLQEIIDKAVEAVTPKEADPETIKRIQKKCGGGGRGVIFLCSDGLRAMRAQPTRKTMHIVKPTHKHCLSRAPSIKAGNERRLDAKKKDAKKKTERRRRDFD